MSDGINEIYVPSQQTAPGTGSREGHADRDRANGEVIQPKEATTHLHEPRFRRFARLKGCRRRVARHPPASGDHYVRLIANDCCMRSPVRFVSNVGELSLSPFALRHSGERSACSTCARRYSKKLCSANSRLLGGRLRGRPWPRVVVEIGSRFFWEQGARSAVRRRFPILLDVNLRLQPKPEALSNGVGGGATARVDVPGRRSPATVPYSSGW